MCQTNECWFHARVKGQKIDFAVTRCNFERFTSWRCQNDCTGVLNSDFESECQCVRDACRSFLLVAGLSVLQIYASVKTIAKCLMNNLSLVCPRDHFDNSVTLTPQSNTVLHQNQLCALWHASGNRILRFSIRFGPYSTDRHENVLITFPWMHGSRKVAWAP